MLAGDGLVAILQQTWNTLTLLNISDTPGMDEVEMGAIASNHLPALEVLIVQNNDDINYDDWKVILAQQWSSMQQLYVPECVLLVDGIADFQTRHPQVEICTSCYPDLMSTP
jgi:hypothetical protein